MSFPLPQPTLSNSAPTIITATHSEVHDIRQDFRFLKAEHEAEHGETAPFRQRHRSLSEEMKVKQREKHLYNKQAVHRSNSIEREADEETTL